MQKFSGEGDPRPLGAYNASIFAPTALKLNVTHPRKNPTAFNCIPKLNMVYEFK